MRTLLSRANLNTWRKKEYTLLKVTMTQPSASVQCAVRTGAAVTMVTGKPEADTPWCAE